MYVKTLKLTNFRNYINEQINFGEDINVIYGLNAQGKTNIIEAIYLCAYGKSFRTSKDKELINLNNNFFEVELEYFKNNRVNNIKIVNTNKKNVFLNGIKLKKLTDLLSNLNIVLFSPDDINIINDNPATRRKFINVLISQLRPNYAHILNNYAKTLDMRNTYLKQHGWNNTIDENVLEIWDEQIAKLSEQIFLYRKKYIEKISNYAQAEQLKLTQNKEKLEIKYISNSHSKEETLKKLKQNRQIDIKRNQTSVGIHRDDIKFYINGKEIKIFGSQGQKRTTILSLKMAELSTICEETGDNPVLLLDDFMSELDNLRIKNYIEKFTNSQVIITCTKKFNIENKKINLYNVENGKVNNLGGNNGKIRT